MYMTNIIDMKLSNECLVGFNNFFFVQIVGVCGKQQKKLEKAIKISRRLGK